MGTGKARDRCIYGGGGEGMTVGQPVWVCVGKEELKSAGTENERQALDYT